MLLFITDYDPATHANWSVARELEQASIIPMLGINATRDRLIDSLNRQQDLPVFAMSHGRKDCLIGQAGATAINTDDVQILADRTMFAWACHTATELGLAVSDAGGRWWGYTGTISAPVEDEPLRGIFSEIFQLIFDVFNARRYEGNIYSELEAIKQRCDQAVEQFNILKEQEQDFDDFQAYSCVKHIWDRLRVWNPYSDSPCHHPDITSPTLFL